MQVALGYRKSEVPRMELLELLPALGDGLLLARDSVMVLVDIPVRAGPCQELGLLIFSLGGNVPSSMVNGGMQPKSRTLRH